MAQGKIHQLKSALLREFGFGAATVDRLFNDILGPADDEWCVNCGANMKEYESTFDCLNAMLLIAIANEVKRAAALGKPFTEANCVKVNDLPVGDSILHRTTHCAKLGLIAKHLVDGKHYPRNTWVITTRGWAALRGEPVPKRVAVWRGEIQERFPEKITLSDALALNAEKLGKIEYNKNEWVEYGKIHEGKI